jgi:hypothetical protein
MSRYTRNSAILAKIETTYGTDAVPTGAANALLVSNLSITPLNAQNVDRGLVRNFMGGSEQLVGNAYKDVSFSVELAGSGTAGTAPAWGALLRACGFAEAVSAAVRVDYTPISSAFESNTIYYHLDGALHKLLGCRGSVSLDMSEGARPVMKFKMLGLDGGVTAIANPSLTLTAWKTPLVITDPNTSDVTLGCTYSAGALSGGTIYPSRGITMDAGNNVQYIPTLGGQTCDITQRVSVGNVTLDLTAAQEVSMMSSVQSNISQGIGLIHGTTAGNKILVHAPAAQMINPKVTDFNGRILHSYDLRLLPVTGNDEIRIVAL